MNETQPHSVFTEVYSQETRENMRFLHFRPWYEDRQVLVGGVGASFAATYASQIASACFAADGFDGDSKTFESAVLMSVPNWQELCLNTAGKQFAIGGSIEDHGSFGDFQEQIESVFGDAPTYWLTQSSEFPYRLQEGADSSGTYWVAVIGDAPQIVWPSMTLTMPTVDSPADVQEAALSFLSSYPGILNVVVVANGSSVESVDLLKQTEDALANVTLLLEDQNLGYGQGCNRGLDYAIENFRSDLIGVTNDDVIADVDCLLELVCGLRGLEAMGFNPGAIGPVSNSISGRQQVDIGSFDSYADLKEAVSRYRQTAARSVTQVRQLRGLLLIFTPELLNAIGGFDPRFGIGNFEDDDHNLRTHLAGYTLWIADGAFLYHRGSQTFRKLKIDYEANIRRNAEALMEKWQLNELDQWPALQSVPRNVTLHVPLASWKGVSERPVTEVSGEAVGLLDQASDDEFVQWLIACLNDRPRSIRAEIVRLLEAAA